MLPKKEPNKKRKRQRKNSNPQPPSSPFPTRMNHPMPNSETLGKEKATNAPDLPRPPSSFPLQMNHPMPNSGETEKETSTAPNSHSPISQSSSLRLLPISRRSPRALPKPSRIILYQIQRTWERGCPYAPCPSKIRSPRSPFLSKKRYQWVRSSIWLAVLFRLFFMSRSKCVGCWSIPEEALKTK